MKKQIILTILEGNFEDGFPVTLDIEEDEYPFKKILKKAKGKFPSAANLNIKQLLQNWQSYYTEFARHQDIMSNNINNPRMEIEGSTKVSYESAEFLRVEFNQWLKLNEELWQDEILTPLTVNLNPDDEIRVIIITDDSDLRRLPWPAWELFEKRYKNSEISLAASEANLPKIQLNYSDNSLVKILAVFGNSKGIDINFDQQILENLKSRNAHITSLKQPTKECLLNCLREKKGWDIFFFAGHSSTIANGKIGKLEINNNDSLSIDDLKNAMEVAIARGLQLAIFNSCDGLGLAYQLGELNLPQSIVMREIVDDEVAKQFLEDFLTDFSENKSLYMSVRNVRGKLEDAKSQKYPGISWLPIICQNITVQPPTWQSLTTRVILAEIRQKLAVANSFRDIEICFDEVEKFLSQYPQDVEGRLLKSDIEQALPRKKTRVSGEEKTWKCRYTLAPHTDLIKSIAIHPNGKIFASSSFDRTIKIWDINTGKLLKNIYAHPGDITCVTFSNNGKILASSSGYPNAAIKLWDTQTWQLKDTFRAHDWEPLNFLIIWSIAMSADGKTLVSGHHADATVKVWNLETGKLRRTLDNMVIHEGHLLAVTSVAIAPDGETIASAGLENKIKIWNAKTGREIRSLNGPGEGVIGLTYSVFTKNYNGLYNVAFSPDGTILASAGVKQPIKLWRLSNGTIKTILTGHQGSVFTVAFSPDGKYLASGSSDRTIRIWDLSKAENIQILSHDDSVLTVAFSPDGHTLISGGRDRKIKIWHLSA
ncbi:MAG: CHAT domain-containing protein [Xenococcus sp. (in: cyanobacteria)]